MGDYPTSVQLSGGSYASSATLAVPPTDASMPGVYPQQIPAIATGQSGAPNSTSVVPQTTLGATNSSLPATASSPLTGAGLQPTCCIACMVSSSIMACSAPAGNLWNLQLGSAQACLTSFIVCPSSSVLASTAHLLAGGRA